MSSCFSRCLRVPIAIRAFYEPYLWIPQTLLLTHPDLHPGLLALANIPTQCSGSFATGIGANGNANCTTPNVIQLQEQQTPPADPPNWGVLWFDQSTHTAHMEDNGQTMQLGLANLFNSDPGGDGADNLEEM